MLYFVAETLRLYGSAHVLSRICTESYKVPDSDLTIEKGMKVIIPLFSLHHDQEYYPDPYEFKPDRFTPEEIKKRHPCVFMPFGEGPRNCIGKSLLIVSLSSHIYLNLGFYFSLRLYSDLD